MKNQPLHILYFMQKIKHQEQKKFHPHITKKLKANRSLLKIIKLQFTLSFYKIENTL